MSKFSIFYGGITKIIPDGEADLFFVFNKIVSEEFKNICEKIQNIKNDDIKELKKERNKIKKHLSYITTAGIFKERRNNALIEMSGYTTIDVDYIDNIIELKEKLKVDPYIKLMFISPSGAGLKLIFSIPKDVGKYKDRVFTIYNYLHKKYEIDISSIDSSTTDISRACYLSYDVDAYYNENAVEFTDIVENIEEPKKKDTSRSAAEYKEIIKLLFSGRKKDYIYNHMKSFSKWKESPQAYKDYTFKKAESYVFDTRPALVGETRKQIIPEIAKKIMDENIIVSIRNDKILEMWIYRNGIYIPQAITYIQEMVSVILKSNYDINIVNKIVDFIRKETYEDIDVFFQEEDIKYICVQNGILNIQTNTLEPFSEKYKFFSKLPVSYNSEATCEITKKHFNTILKHDDIILMQEIYGYLLYRDYNIQRAILFSGDGGNGKGKTIDQMKCVIGINNVTNISLHAFEQDKFIKSALHKKLANLGADLGKTELKSTSTFRELTGEDLVTAQRKFLEPIHFKNYAKMIFAVNTLPYIDENTDGFWRRWIYIDFPVAFLPKNDYERRKANNTLEDNHRLADTKMTKKLTSDEELSGVLNWALEGLHRILKNEDFSYDKSYDETKMMMQKRESSAIAFMQDCIEFINDGDEYVTNDDMYCFYRKYCIASTSKLKVESDLNFRKILGNHGTPVERKRIATGYELRWYYTKFKNEIYKKIFEGKK